MLVYEDASLMASPFITAMNTVFRYPDTNGNDMYKKFQPFIKLSHNLVLSI